MLVKVPIGCMLFLEKEWICMISEVTHYQFLNRCEREQEGLGYEFISLLSDNAKQILTEMQGQ